MNLTHADLCVWPKSYIVDHGGILNTVSIAQKD